MAVTVSLRKVVDELEALMDGTIAYLNRTTGDLCAVQEEEAGLADDDVDLDDLPDWQRDEVTMVREVLGSADWLPLPTRFDIHEWAIMDEFSSSIDDPDLRDELLQAIRGAGAFRCFRDAIRRHGIQERWYGYRTSTLTRIAVDWLEEHAISYARDIREVPEHPPAPAAPSRPLEPNERIRWLAGCWDLADCTFTAGDGTALAPWGSAPVGVLLITPEGELSAHAGRRTRVCFAGEHPTPGEKQKVYDDYVSYFGRIVRLDDEAGTLVVAVDGASDPGWIGGEQHRGLEIRDADTIVLRTPPLALAGSEVVGCMVWTRRSGGAG